MSNLNAVVMAKVRECVEAIEQQTGKKLVVPTVVWSNKMSRSWGKASFIDKTDGRREYIITLSAKVFNAETNALRNTVAHEVAHIADLQLYKNWGHGPTWAMIMSRMLNQPARRLATREEMLEVAPTAKVTRRLMTKYVYSCKCQTHLVSAQAHSKIMKGVGYCCRACASTLVFSNKVTKA
jgi:predicted SprT family Zn-dependent metalloprotease